MLFVFQALAFFSVASLDIARRGFPLDDAWIHQVVARTFAQTGTLGYAEGSPGAAATSYLWAAVLSLNYLVVGISPQAYTLVLNAVLLAVCGQALLTLVLTDLSGTEGSAYPLLTATGITAAAACSANFVWFAHSGMEATLFAACALSSSALALSNHSHRRLTGTLGGTALAGLALVRPEGVPLGAIVLVAAWAGGRTRNELMRLAAPWLAASLAYFGWNWVFTGTPLPATLAGRRWLWLASEVGVPTALVQLGFLATWVRRLKDYTLGGASFWLVWVALGAAAHGVVDAVRRRHRGALVLATLAAAHLAFYAVLLPTPGQGGRYQPLTPMVITLLASYGAIHLLHHVAPFTSRVGVASAMLNSMVLGGSLAAGTSSLRAWRAAHASAVTHIERTEVGIAQAVATLPPTATVGSFDIGATGFFSGHPIVDLGGLASQRAAQVMMDGKLWETVRSLTYIVLPLSYDFNVHEPINVGYRLRLIDNDAVALAPVEQRETTPEAWLPGVRATWSSAPRQVLFRVIDTGRAGPSALRPAGHGPRVSFRNGGLSLRQTYILQHAVDVLAGSGVDVRIAFEGEAFAEGTARAWEVRIGAAGLKVTPPGAGPAAPRMIEEIEGAVAPYVQVGDLFGGALRALHSIIAGIQRNVDPAFYPLLPPVNPPLREHDDDPLEDTGLLGLAVAGAVLVFELFGRRRVAAGLDTQDRR